MRTALAILVLLALGAEGAGAAAGDFDSSFDGDGTVLIDSSALLTPSAIAVTPDGKTVIAGYEGTGVPLVARLRHDGSLDPAFGNGGYASLPGVTDGLARAVVIQPDGKVLVGGRSDQDAVVYRFRDDGTLDPDFDDDGKALLDTGVDGEQVDALALGPDGRIVAGGTTKQLNGDAVVWRLNANGTPDTTFDTDGAAGLDTGGTSEGVTSVALTPDGRIVAAGSTYSSGTGTSNVVVWRLLVDGGDGGLNNARDPTFDGDGTAGLSGQAREIDLSIAPDGKLVLAGAAVDPPGAAVWRLKADGGDGSLDGALDPGFNSGAPFVLPGLPNGVGRAVEHAHDGKLVAAAVTDFANQTAEVFRLTENGLLDMTFSADGRVQTTGITPSLALTADRRIVVSTEPNWNIQVLRMFGDPYSVAVSRSGAGSGAVTSAPAGLDCGAACSLALDAGSSLALSALPAAGSVFAGWSGDCAGTEACTVTVPGDRSVEARFEPAPAPSPSPSPDPGPPFSLDGLPASIKLTKKGRGKLAFTARVGGTFKLTARVRKRRHTLASGTFAADGRIAFKLSKALRRKLGKKRRLRAKLTVTAEGVTASRTIVLKLARKTRAR